MAHCARLLTCGFRVPLLGYSLWVWLSAGTLWARYPALREPRDYRFKPESYLLETAQGEAKVGYKDVAQALSSRRALYLIRWDGSADIFPRDALPEGLETSLGEKLEIERSSFL